MENLLWWKIRAIVKRYKIFIFIAFLNLAIALTETKKIGNPVIEESEAGLSSDINRNEYDGTVNLKSLGCYHSFDNKTCVTPECVRTATRVLEYMDPNVDPCDDFYEFACGNFIKYNKVPDGRKSVTIMSLLLNTVKSQLRTVVEDLINPNESRPFELLQRYYQACMNTVAIEKDGLDTIKLILRDVGGWPVIEEGKWNERKFDWKKTMYKFRKIGLTHNSLLTVSHTRDPRNTSRLIPYVSPPNFDVTDAYYNYMVDVAVMFGANEETAKQDLKQSFEFELKLSKAVSSLQEQETPTKLMAVCQLQKKFSTIPWLEYLNSVVGVSDVKIKISDAILVKGSSYISELEKIIAKTPKRVQANYIMWDAIHSIMPYLTEELQQRFKQYQNQTGTKTLRWEKCIDEVSIRFRYPLGAVYFRHFLNEEAKEHSIEMLKNFKNEFVKILKKAQWIDDVTRKAALEKISAMRPFIAFLPDLYSEPKLTDHYAKLNFASENFLNMYLNIELLETDKFYRMLLFPLNLTEIEFDKPPFDVNAFHFMETNTILLPVGILQDALFNQDRPRYMNYGAMGYFIGHEMTHGFDDRGRLFDKDGNKVNWWTPSASKAFNEKTQCLVDQYGKYTILESDVHVDGLNTLGENIADNGAVNEAYMAYNTWTKQNGEEQQLPCLNYTTRQMFWISVGQAWCAKYKPEAIPILLKNTHSPAKFRINGPLSNSLCFAKDFHCSKKTKMNPVNKCIVW